MGAAWGPYRVKASTNFFLIFLVLFVSRQKEQWVIGGFTPDKTDYNIFDKKISNNVRYFISIRTY